MKITVCWQNKHQNNLNKALIASPILAGPLDYDRQLTIHKNNRNICTHPKFLLNGLEQCVHPGGPAFWDWFDKQPEGIAMHSGLIDKCEVEYDGEA